MLLAQLDYDQNKFADGIKALASYQTAGAAGPSLAAIWALTGDGQGSMGKPSDAAGSYRKAAEATPYPAERSLYLAKTARALMADGKDAEALASNVPPARCEFARRNTID